MLLRYLRYFWYSLNYSNDKNCFIKKGEKFCARNRFHRQRPDRFRAYNPTITKFIHTPAKPLVCMRVCSAIAANTAVACPSCFYPTPHMPNNTPIFAHKTLCAFLVAGLAWAGGHAQAQNLPAGILPTGAAAGAAAGIAGNAGEVPAAAGRDPRNDLPPRRAAGRSARSRRRHGRARRRSCRSSRSSWAARLVRSSRRPTT